MKLLCLVLMLCLSLAACGGKKLEGKYENDVFSLEFKGGKVYQLNKGTTMELEFDYKVDGDKLKLIAPSGTMVMSILDDGSIEGIGGTYSKLTYMEGKYLTPNGKKSMFFHSNGQLELIGDDYKKGGISEQGSYAIRGNKLLLTVENAKSGKKRTHDLDFTMSKYGSYSLDRVHYFNENSPIAKRKPAQTPTTLEGKYVAVNDDGTEKIDPIEFYPNGSAKGDFQKEASSYVIKGKEFIFTNGGKNFPGIITFYEDSSFDLNQKDEKKTILRFFKQ